MKKNHDYLETELTDDYKKLDAQQLEVCVKDSNAVVAAGAGSGKTETLATRYAYLLMSDDDLHVENILALTFTKKAAGEIYERVYKKLLFFRDTLSDPKFGGKYKAEVFNAKRALSEFGDAKIQTLDSYGGTILRVAANLYGVKPDFVTGSTTCETSVIEQALPFVLKYRNEKCFQKFCSPGEIEKFAKNYFADPILKHTSLATDENYFTRMMEQQKKIAVDEWNGFIKKIFVPKFNSILKGMKSNRDLLFVKKDKITFGEKFADELEALDKFSKIEIENEFVLSEENIRDQDVLEKMKSIALIAEKFPAKKPGGKEEKEILNPIIDEVNALKKETEIYSGVIPFFEEMDTFARMYALLDEFLEIVNTTKRATGDLTFKDVTDMALKILLEQPQIREQQKRLIRKIMIDEFQDNNSKNRDLLFLLAEKNGVAGKDMDEVKKNLSTDKLFFVGDEKQSIYKFRGADVSVFNQLQKDLEEVNAANGISGGKVRLDMQNNYRSCPELLWAFNAFFGTESETGDITKIPSIFHSDEKNLPDYEAGYKKNATWHGETPAAVTDKNQVKIHACVFNKDKNFFAAHRNLSSSDPEKCLDFKDTEYYFIVRKISEIYSREMEEFENGLRKKKPKYSDFAVLERGRSNRVILGEFMTLFNIPFVVDCQSRIFSDGIVNDIYNFLRLCVYPSDVPSYAAFLTSPFASVSLQGVQNILALSISGEDEKIFRPFAILDDAEWESKAGLSETDRNRFLAAKKFYDEKRGVVLSESLTHVLEKLWYESGYCFETMLDENLKLLSEQMDMLYEMARNVELAGQSVSWFVDQLDSLKKSEESFGRESDELDAKEVKYPLEKPDAVQVMTIHMSKGLEFEHVFVFGLNYSARADKEENLYFSEESGISLKTNSGMRNYFYLKGKEEDAGKTLAELKRIIYVAVTRARQDVYIVFDLENQKSVEQRSASNDRSDTKTTLIHKLFRNYYSLSENEDRFSVNYHDEAVYENNAPFDYIKINPVPFAVKKKSFAKKHADLRDEKIEEFRKKFSDAVSFEGTEEYSKIFGDRVISPSSLEDYSSREVREYFGGLEMKSDFRELSAILEKTLKTRTAKNPGAENQAEPASSDASDSAESENREPEKFLTYFQFTRGNFGTMTHSYMEHFVNTGDTSGVEEYGNFDRGIAEQLEELFSEEDHKKLSGMCSRSALNFSRTETGKQLEDAKKNGRLVKAESKFLLNLGGTIVNGIMDLVFENADGTFTIVDYKTVEKIWPSTFVNQLAAYRKACSELYGVPAAKIRTVLYYTLFDAEIDITPYTDKSDEELAAVIPDEL